MPAGAEAPYYEVLAGADDPYYEVLAGAEAPYYEVLAGVDDPYYEVLAGAEAPYYEVLAGAEAIALRTFASLVLHEYGIMEECELTLLCTAARSKGEQRTSLETSFFQYQQYTVKAKGNMIIALIRPQTRKGSGLYRLCCC